MPDLGVLLVPTPGGAPGDGTLNGKLTAIGLDVTGTVIDLFGIPQTSQGGSATNTGYGTGALAVNTGPFNTAYGQNALGANTAGGQISAFGQSALANFNEPSSVIVNLVAIGYGAGLNYTGAERNDIVIGAGIGGTVGESNVLRIGNLLVGTLPVTAPAVPTSAGLAVGGTLAATGVTNLLSSTAYAINTILMTGFSTALAMLKTDPNNRLQLDPNGSFGGVTTHFNTLDDGAGNLSAYAALRAQVAGPIITNLVLLTAFSTNTQIMGIDGLGNLEISGPQPYLIDPSTSNSFHIGATGLVTNVLFTAYGNISVKGFGVPAIPGLDNRTGVTAPDAAAITLYTTTAAGQLYRITLRVNATAYTSGTASYALSWTERGVVLFMHAYATATNQAAAQSTVIQPDAGTAINVQITGTFVATLNAAAVVEEMA